MTRMMDMCGKILRGRISLLIHSSIIIISDHGKLSKMFFMENYVTRALPIRNYNTFQKTCPCFQNYLSIQASDYVLFSQTSIQCCFSVCLMANDWFNKGFVFYDSVLQGSNISGALELNIPVT